MPSDETATERDRAAMAWELYCEDNVVCPEFGDEIAERKALLREWAAAGRGLR